MQACDYANQWSINLSRNGPNLYPKKTKWSIILTTLCFSGNRIGARFRHCFFTDALHYVYLEPKAGPHSKAVFDVCAGLSLLQGE